MSTISSLACPLCGGPLRSIWARRRRDGRLARRRRCECGYAVQTVEEPVLALTPRVVDGLLTAMET